LVTVTYGTNHSKKRPFYHSLEVIIGLESDQLLECIASCDNICSRRVKSTNAFRIGTDWTKNTG